MPNVTLVCETCGSKARRPLMQEAGSRGVHETSSEPASCPKGHGLMKREDGLQQERWASWAEKKLLTCSDMGCSDKHEAECGTKWRCLQCERDTRTLPARQGMCPHCGRPNPSGVNP